MSTAPMMPINSSNLMTTGNGSPSLLAARMNPNGSLALNSIHANQVLRQEVPGDLLPYRPPTVANNSNYAESKSPHIIYHAQDLVNPNYGFGERIEEYDYVEDTYSNVQRIPGSPIMA